MRNILWCILFLALLGTGCAVIMHSKNTRIGVDTSVQGATINL